MVVSMRGAVIIAAIFLVVLVLAEIAELFIGGDIPVLMVSLLLLVGGIGGWYARHNGIAMDADEGETTE